MSKFVLTQAYLKEILHCDPDTGVLTWIRSSRSGWVGKIAGAPFKGYLRVKIRNKNYLAHRLVWLYVYGYLPDEVDHKDGVGSHNWIKNLRDATHAQNIQNVKTKSNNTSGVKNVHWCRLTNKWRATFCTTVSETRNGETVKRRKVIHVGLFTDIAEAAEAVRKRREELHAEFANHG